MTPAHSPHGRRSPRHELDSSGGRREGGFQQPRTHGTRSVCPFVTSSFHAASRPRVAPCCSMRPRPLPFSRWLTSRCGRSASPSPAADSWWLPSLATVNHAAENVAVPAQVPALAAHGHTQQQAWGSQGSSLCNLGEPSPCFLQQPRPHTVHQPHPGSNLGTSSTPLFCCWLFLSFLTCNHRDG